MAVFDIEQQRMCVRVVYDGAASAGKTTNVRQLSELFATQRTCEVFSPAEMSGRTLYFDWLQIAAGMACGVPLVCQVITVPGQSVLTPRRRHLLASADVVVHVCDSAENAATRAVDGLTLFDEVERERGERIPLVVQANKQDQQGAVSGAALLAMLERRTVPVVEAIAADGIGVIDTFVAAVRAAVRSIQARVDSGAVRVAVKHAETANEVFEKLSAQAVDPEWAIEVMLEEASNAFTVGDWLEAAPPPEEPAPAAPSDPPETEHAVRSSDTWRPARPTRFPALPNEHVPTGFIWPAHTGRAALRSLASEPGMKAPAALEEDGTLRLTLGGFVLTTRHDRRFDNAENARQALVRAARERTQLGPLLAPETVLVAQPAADEATWLWTVLPSMPAVADLLVSPERAGAQRTTLLAAFGTAMADALKVEAQYGRPLDLSPWAFGVRVGVVRFLGEIPPGEPAPRDAGRAVVDAFAALATVCDGLEPAVAAFESTLFARLSPEELAKLAHTSTWQGMESLPGALRTVRQRVEEAFSRRRAA